MSFDRLAPHYRWMEAVCAGGLLQRCRVRWLAEVRNARRALLAGEGNGRMLSACALAMPGSEFVVLDQSREMLARARRRWDKCGQSQRITFEQVDLRRWNWELEPFDLVITNFLLDCFAPDELQQVIKRIAAATTPQARWVNSDFTVPERGWQRVRAQVGLSMAYGFFRCVTGISARRIVDPSTFLHAAGFGLRARAEFDHGLLYTELWERGI
ncbi:MAG TPA: class I SAM-dependent methyltransferase [Verrucomicrobiae bacterium]|nr:class I SAM-dependent methyltransferase [Verrucomicrobiae bacterium]